MPVLPGLVAWNAANASASASPDEQEKEKDKLGQGQLADPSPSSPSSPSTDSTSWRKPNKDQLQMRNLARQGKEDAEKAALTDRLVLYKRLER